MEFSDTKKVAAVALGGHELMQQVVTLTGLPDELVHDELEMILASAGQKPGDLTLEGLRSAMLAYLEELERQEFADAAKTL